MQSQPKTRSSLKRLSESVYEHSITDRPQRRRVSFSRIICVKDNLNSEELFPLSSASDETFDGRRSLTESTYMSVETVSVCSNKNESSLPDMEISPLSPVHTDLQPPISPVTVDMSVDDETISDEQATPTAVSEPSVSMEVESSVLKTPVVCTNRESETEHYPPTNSATRPITASLPPLRHHPNMPVLPPPILSCPRSYRSDTKTLSDNRNNTATSQVFPLRADSRLLSQSTFCATPLRQVSPSNLPALASRSVASHDGTHLKLSKLPLSQLHAYPLVEAHDQYLCTPKSLKSFLARKPLTSMDSELETDHFPDNLDQLRDQFPELLSEFTERRAEVGKRIKLFLTSAIHSSVSRQSHIQASHVDSLPVVQQLKTMTTAQFIEFFGQSHEILRQCELHAENSYRDLLKQFSQEYADEQSWELRRLEEVESQLDRELLALQHELDYSTSRVKAQNEMENLLKEFMKDLSLFDEERDKLAKATSSARSEISQLIQSLNEVSKSDRSSCADTCSTPVYIGATPMCAPSTTHGTKIDPMDEVACCFTPFTLNLVSPENRTFELQALFGLLSFQLECDKLSSTSGHEECTTLSMDSYVISSVKCVSTADDQRMVDCPPVESLADYACRFFSSRDGRSQLHSRFVGATLDKAIEHFNDVLCPYHILAADMRALYFANHQVEFDGALPVDMALLASAFKTQQSTTPSSQSVLQDRNASHLPWEHYSHNRLFPSSPVTVSVTIYEQTSLSVISLQFSFPSINAQAVISTNVLVTCGNVSVDPINALLAKSKIYPGTLHRVVGNVVDFLTLSVT